MDRRTFVSGSAVLALSASVKFAQAAQTRLLLLVGSRSSAPGQGIHSCFMDPNTGDCTRLSLAAELAMPTVLALSHDGRTLYAVSEVGDDGKSDGSVAAFRLDQASGSLTLLNQISSGGGGPTSLALDRNSRTLVLGSYGNGRTNAFRLLPDGSLGKQTATMQDTGMGPTPRQNAPHVHCVVFSPNNRFVLAADFGADKLLVFRVDVSTGTLTPHNPAFLSTPPGSGPRQVAFHPNGRTVYLLSELAATVTVFSFDPKHGILKMLQTLSCFPEGYTGERSGAGLAVHPSGAFLYTTTRTDNAIEVFHINAGDGTLSFGQRWDAAGKLPWGCALDAAGSYLAVTNTKSDAVSVFFVDPANGNLKLIGSVPDVVSPVWALVIQV